ncbi:MAG: hypothetical protein Q9O62_05500 [Ardenticatenia bacterium]|nr:hypothetical protein [Ardenticatenia bacterium]
MAWWQHLRGKPFYHLLSKEHPAAWAFTLQHVMTRPRRTPTMAEANLALRQWPLVRRVLDKMHPEGWWERPDTLWSPRYTSTLWRLRLLAEFHVPGTDERIATATDRLLNLTTPTLADELIRGETETIPINVDAIITFIPLAFGFVQDGRVQQRVRALQAAILRGLWPGDVNTQADWLAQAAATLALAPRPNPIAVARLADALLDRPLHTLPERWLRFGAPTFDRPDLLFAARALLQLGVRDSRLQTWVEFIVAKQRHNGRGGLTLERSLHEAADFPAEAAGQFSRWLTAQALFIMAEWYGHTALPPA